MKIIQNRINVHLYCSELGVYAHMNNLFFPVILAGGKGERFWPLSRLDRPKQFLSLDGSSRSLLQATADRLLTLSGRWENLWVITSSPIAQGVREQLPDLPERSKSVV